MEAPVRQIGNHPDFEFPLYRQFIDIMLMTSQNAITVIYDEWMVLPNGKIWHDKAVGGKCRKKYHVVDVPAVTQDEYDEEGNVISSVVTKEANLRYTNWRQYKLNAGVVIDNCQSLEEFFITQATNTLEALPILVADGLRLG
jgi:hypothetical protein